MDVPRNISDGGASRIPASGAGQPLPPGLAERLSEARIYDRGRPGQHSSSLVPPEAAPTMRRMERYEDLLLDNMLTALDRLYDQKCGGVDVQALAQGAVV